VVEVGSVEVELGSAVVAVVLGSAAPASGALWSWTAMRSAVAGPIQARRREGSTSRHHPGEMEGTEPWIRSNPTWLMEATSPAVPEQHDLYACNTRVVTVELAVRPGESHTVPGRFVPAACRPSV
jgi:hypothetical protein